MSNFKIKKIVFVLVILAFCTLPLSTINAQEADGRSGTCKGPTGGIIEQPRSDVGQCAISGGWVCRDIGMCINQCETQGGTWVPNDLPMNMVNDYLRVYSCYNDNNVTIPANSCFDCTAKGGAWRFHPPTSAPNEGEYTPNSYHLLAPFPGVIDEDFNPAAPNALSIYLNLMIKILIGLAGVFAVIAMVMGGIEYMTSELLNTKEHGRSMMTNALLGLLIALGAYTLLNTINPTLLNTTFNPETATLNNYFEASGALTRTGAPVNIKFNEEAYPAAKSAGDHTGVNPALILAIFSQETSSGLNTGRCTPANANMIPADLAALPAIVGANNVATTNMSCPAGGGHGGAIGLMQILPTTWLQYRDSSSRDPWNVNDAFMVAALKLKSDGGASNPYQAACKYFGQCSFGGIDYAAQVMSKMQSIQAQIDEAKQKGTIR